MAILDNFGIHVRFLEGRTKLKMRFPLNVKILKCSSFFQASKLNDTSSENLSPNQAGSHGFAYLKDGPFKADHKPVLGRCMKHPFIIFAKVLKL